MLLLHVYHIYTNVSYLPSHSCGILPSTCPVELLGFPCSIFLVADNLGYRRTPELLLWVSVFPSPVYSDRVFLKIYVILYS